MKLRSGRIISKITTPPPASSIMSNFNKSSNTNDKFCDFCGKVHSNNNSANNYIEKQSENDIRRSKTIEVIRKYLSEIDKTKGRLNKCIIATKMFTFINLNIDYITSTNFHSQGNMSKFVQTVYDKCIELQGEVLHPTAIDLYSDQYIEESRDIQSFYDIIKTVKKNLEFHMYKKY